MRLALGRRLVERLAQKPGQWVTGGTFPRAHQPWGAPVGLQVPCQGGRGPGHAKTGRAPGLSRSSTEYSRIVQKQNLPSEGLSQQARGWRLRAPRPVPEPHTHQRRGGVKLALPGASPQPQLRAPAGKVTGRASALRPVDGQVAQGKRPGPRPSPQHFPCAFSLILLEKAALENPRLNKAGRKHLAPSVAQRTPPQAPPGPRLPTQLLGEKDPRHRPAHCLCPLLPGLCAPLPACCPCSTKIPPVPTTARATARKASLT